MHIKFSKTKEGGGKKEGKKGSLVTRQIVGEMSGLIFKGTFPSSNNSL